MAFSQPKAAQAAAWFLGQSQGSMSILKLMKLLYLADRLSLKNHERTITGDRMVSMPHGPVLSMTYELSNGLGASEPGGWCDWIRDREGHMISLKPGRAPDRESLDCLSDADIQVLSDTYREFGRRDGFWLRDYTHRECAEWTDPSGSSIPIQDETVLRAVGKPEQQAKLIAERMQAERDLDSLFARL